MKKMKSYLCVFVVTFILGVVLVGVSPPEVMANVPGCPGLACTAIIQCLDISPLCPATGGWALHRVGFNGDTCQNPCVHFIGCGC